MVRLLVVTSTLARHIMTAFNPRIVPAIKVGQQPLAESVLRGSRNLMHLRSGHFLGFCSCQPGPMA